MNKLQLTEFHRFPDLVPDIQHLFIKAEIESLSSGRLQYPALALTCKSLFAYASEFYLVVNQENIAELLTKENSEKLSRYCYVKISQKIDDSSQLSNILHSLSNVVSLYIDLIDHKDFWLLGFPNLERLVIKSIQSDVCCFFPQPKLRSFIVGAMEPKSMLVLSRYGTRIHGMIIEDEAGVEIPMSRDIFPNLESFVVLSPATKIYMMGLNLPDLTELEIATGHNSEIHLSDTDVKEGTPAEEAVKNFTSA